MPVIETQRDDIRALRGVHLFHFATSNCSQRVRFTLEETGVGWTSHHINLIKCENATAEFVAINPKGVVPVLVHDGITIVESNDIIRYVDEQFGGSALTPEAGMDRDYLEESLQHSSHFQAALKLLTHEFLFKPLRRMNERQLEDYTNGTGNSELAGFMREFSSSQGFAHERISLATQEAQDMLGSLEARLETHRWLSGQLFGLADISWVVNLHRMGHMHYPLAPFPGVQDWLTRTRARPAFRAAISRYESSGTIAIFNTYSIVRRLQRSSVRSYISELRS
ncbi:glutathione S-transferase family protein [Haliea sp. E17]|uniref:glutathione S-transferase family protein n=1 Tax=Haliea sp. E17 TaxID=3401576 RepID=UPI003AAF187B